MARFLTLLLVLGLAACQAGGGPSGAYVGGATGANIRDDARPLR